MELFLIFIWGLISRSVLLSWFCSLRDMYKARCCLIRETCEMLLHAFIVTHFDYCNALLYGLPKKQITKLQEVQNSAAQLVTDTRKYDHITPMLIELHWLPVQKQIVFKILLLTFKHVKCLHGLGPSCPSDLIVKMPSLELTINLSLYCQELI